MSQYDFNLSNIDLSIEDGFVDLILEINELCAKYKLKFEIDPNNRSIVVIDGKSSDIVKNELNKESRFLKRANPSKVDVVWNDDDFIFTINYSYFIGSIIPTLKAHLKANRSTCTVKAGVLLVSPSRIVKNAINNVTNGILSKAKETIKNTAKNGTKNFLTHLQSENPLLNIFGK